MQIVDQLQSNAPFISHEDHINREWVQAVLTTAANGAPAIRSVAFKRIGEGMIGKNLRIDIDYEPGSNAAQVFPQSLVVKFPSDGQVSRQTGANGRLYEREVKFYRQVAPFLNGMVAKAHMAEISANNEEFCLVMEDMAPCEQGEQIQGCTVEEAQWAMDAAAQLHAPFWGSDEILRHEWLDRQNLMSRSADLVAERTPAFLAIYQDKLSQADLDLVARFARLAPQYYALQRGPLTITHGDYRLDNMMFRVQGGARNICVVDWQTVLVRPGMTDVSFFIGCGLLTETRERHERDLVTRYHRQLQANGVADYSWDDCWRDYRLYAPQGLVQAILALTTTSRTERGDRLFQVMTERHCAQMRHLGTLDLVEQLSQAAEGAAVDSA